MIMHPSIRRKTVDLKPKTFARPFAIIGLSIVMHVSEMSGAGSGYSRFGIGDIRYYLSERSAGMGGAGIALLGTGAVNTINPAAWTQINRMRFSIGAAYEGFAIRDLANSTFLSGAAFNGFALALPISTDNGFVVSAGLTPYSVANFSVASTVNQPGYPYTLKQFGEGGLSNVHLGLSTRIGDHWHLGAKLNYLFGTVDHNTDQTFGSSQFTDATLRRVMRMNGASFTAGIIFSGLADAMDMPESDQLAIGAVATTGGRLATMQENLYEYTSGRTVIARDTIPVAEGNSSLPFSAGVGAVYTLRERWLFAADLYYQNWNRFDILGAKPGEIRDSYRVSAGAELLPRRDIASGFLERTAYRFGLFYQTTNLQIAGKGINEFGITGGLGVPMFGDTRFTVNVEYGIRGTVDIEKDNILRVSFALNVGELWFYRPPEE